MTEKKDFCCMVLCGYGSGQQDGKTLCEHLQRNGIDAVLVPPCAEEKVHLSRRYWIHTVRMKYLTLRKDYQRIAVIGLSIGGMMGFHLAEFQPAAAVFINSPMGNSSIQEIRRLFRRDLKSELGGLRSLFGCYQLWRFVQDTGERSISGLKCPTLIIQTRDDKVSDPNNAEELYERLHGNKKNLRYYDNGGHNVLDSKMDLSVCSDVFQFCSSVRGEMENKKKPAETL